MRMQWEWFSFRSNLELTKRYLYLNTYCSWVRFWMIYCYSSIFSVFHLKVNFNSSLNSRSEQLDTSCWALKLLGWIFKRIFLGVFGEDLVRTTMQRCRNLSLPDDRISRSDSTQNIFQISGLISKQYPWQMHGKVGFYWYYSA